MTSTPFLYTIALFSLLCLSTSCAGPQEPIFTGMENLKVDMISTGRITITGQAVYHNPNAIGGTLTSTSIHVTVNDIEAATIDQDVEIPVPAQSEFRVPLTFNTTPREIFQRDAGGILGSLVNALVDKKVDVHYKGHVTVKLAGISYTSPIEYEEEVALK